VIHSLLILCRLTEARFAGIFPSDAAVVVSTALDAVRRPDDSRRLLVRPKSSIYIFYVT